MAQHWPELRSGGGIIYDEGLKLPCTEGELKERGIKLLKLPLARIATEEGGSRVMTNTAALGAATGITGFPVEHLEGIIEEKGKGAPVVEANLAARIRS